MQGEGRVLGMQDKVTEGKPLGFQPVTPPAVGKDAPPLVPLLEIANAEIGDLQQHVAELQEERDQHVDAARMLWTHLRDVVAHVRTVQQPDMALPDPVGEAIDGMVEYAPTYQPVDPDAAE